MVLMKGLAPSTYGLQNRCTTIVLHQRNVWWREVESNQPNHEGADLQSAVFTVLLSLHTPVD